MSNGTDHDESPESSLTSAPTDFPGPLVETNQSDTPFANGGRDAAGRFVVGNRAASGHAAPLARRVARLRSQLLRSSTPARMRAGVEALWERFAEGDVAAGKLLLSYCLGPPESLDLIHQVTRLEGLLYRGVESNG
jgi:hypothetical protein